VRDLDDLAVFRAQTSAQTAAEHINVRSIHLLCRPPQARTAAVTHLPSAPSAHPVPVWRARASTKTRDYRTFESAHRAQTTCAPAHQQARKQAPQSVAQWLQPFSRNVPPLSSRTWSTSTVRGIGCCCCRRHRRLRRLRRLSLRRLSLRRAHRRRRRAQRRGRRRPAPVARPSTHQQRPLTKQKPQKKKLLTDRWGKTTMVGLCLRADQSRGPIGWVSWWRLNMWARRREHAPRWWRAAAGSGAVPLVVGATHRATHRVIPLHVAPTPVPMCTLHTSGAVHGSDARRHSRVVRVRMTGPAQRGPGRARGYTHWPKKRFQPGFWRARRRPGKEGPRAVARTRTRVPVSQVHQRNACTAWRWRPLCSVCFWPARCCPWAPNAVRDSSTLARLGRTPAPCAPSPWRGQRCSTAARLPRGARWLHPCRPRPREAPTGARPRPLPSVRLSPRAARRARASACRVGAWVGVLPV